MVQEVFWRQIRSNSEPMHHQSVTTEATAARGSIANSRQFEIYKGRAKGVITSKIPERRTSVAEGTIDF
jgi:hypothetical protein